MFVTQTPPMGYSMSHVKRFAKLSIFIRGIPYFALWRNVADSAFLQQAPDPKIASTVCQRFQSGRSLPSLGTDARIAVRHYYGFSPYQQDCHPPVQWCISTDGRTAPLSRPIYPAAVPQTSASQNHSPDGTSPRQFAGLSICITQKAYHFGVRCGLGRYNCLWKARGSACRLQPQEAWKTFLPSNLLFRISLPRVLARKSAAWRRGSIHRSHPLSQGMLGQGAAAHRQKSHSISNGLRILRPADAPLPRGGRLPVCNRRQRVSQHKEAVARLSLSEAGQCLGSRRVSREGSSKSG